MVKTYFFLVTFLLTYCFLRYPAKEQIREVTVSEFREFVEATGYQTDSERYGYSGYMLDYSEHVDLEGSNWKTPDGKTAAKPNEPVRCTSWNDAQTFAKWKGTRLPTAAEYWEKSKKGIIWTGAKQPRETNQNISNIGNVWGWSNDTIQGHAQILGGSYLCKPSTCRGYKEQTPPQYLTITSGNSNTGIEILE